MFHTFLFTKGNKSYFFKIFVTMFVSQQSTFIPTKTVAQNHRTSAETTIS